MQTPTTKRKAQATNPAWPPLPDTGNPLFSLAWFFRKVTELEVTNRHLSKMYDAKRCNLVLRHVLCRATIDLEEQVKLAAVCARKEGLLPFAWIGSTTATQLMGAAQ